MRNEIVNLKDFKKVNDYTCQIKNIIINLIKHMIDNENFKEIEKYGDLIESLQDFNEKISSITSEITPIEYLEKEKTLKKPNKKIKSIKFVKTKNTYTNENTIIKSVGRPKKRLDLKEININETNIYSLEYDFTSTKPISYTLFSKTNLVKSWKHLFESVCIDIINEYDNSIEKLLSSEELKGSKLNYVSKSPKRMRSPFMVSKNDMNIFIETYGSSKVLIELLKRIMSCFDLSTKDIKIEIKK